VARSLLRNMSECAAYLRKGGNLMSRYRLLVLGLILLAVGLGGLVALQAGPLSQPRWTGTPVADGELIFRTGRGKDGRPIPSTQGLPMQMSCAACHGARGQGGRRVLMMRAVDVSPITWTALTSAHQEREEHHPPYTEASLRRAITQGVNSGGEPLDPLMPRWQLTDDEGEALLAYLKTLQ